MIGKLGQFVQTRGDRAEMAARSASSASAAESLNSQRPWPWPRAVSSHPQELVFRCHIHSFLGLQDRIVYEDCRAIACS